MDCEERSSVAGTPDSESVVRALTFCAEIAVLTVKVADTPTAMCSRRGSNRDCRNSRRGSPVGPIPKAPTRDTGAPTCGYNTHAEQP